MKYLCSRNTEQSLISATLMIMLLSIPTIAIGQARDLYSDSWVATDSLGRTLPGYAEVGPKQTDKYVGMFYFLWHGEHGTDLYDNTKLIRDFPFRCLENINSSARQHQFCPNHLEQSRIFVSRAVFVAILITTGLWIPRLPSNTRF